jgi:hypothetical protein
LTAAQDFEALEGGVFAQRVVIAARDSAAGTSLGCLFASTLSGKHLLAYGHREFLTLMRVAGDDVRLQTLLP